MRERDTERWRRTPYCIGTYRPASEFAYSCATPRNALNRGGRGEDRPQASLRARRRRWRCGLRDLLGSKSLGEPSSSRFRGDVITQKGSEAPASPRLSASIERGRLWLRLAVLTAGCGSRDPCRRTSLRVPSAGGCRKPSRTHRGLSGLGSSSWRTYPRSSLRLWLSQSRSQAPARNGHDRLAPAHPSDGRGAAAARPRRPQRRRPRRRPKIR